jgi:hypothetical protein
MTEKVVEGPGTLVPEAVQDPLLRARNRESLRRLIDIALGRETAKPAEPGKPAEPAQPAEPAEPATDG